MDLSSSSKPELLVPPQQIAAVNSTSKRRKMIQQTVITVKVEENSSKQRGDGPPSDTWSWRKYGQKPIKGSPYPRNYYRCSTAKGCSAKKQVEKCRNDSSTLIITYTSSHNHPGVSESLHVLPGPVDLFQGNSSPKSNTATIYELENCNNTEAQPPSISPTIGCSETTITQTEEKRTLDSPRSIISNDKEGPLPYPLTTSTTSTRLSSKEDDFFDELEELPISPSFASLLRSSFFDERILLPTQ